MLAFSFINLSKKVNNQVKVILVFLLLVFIFVAVGSEISRDISYKYTVGHRYLPVSNEGGLSETIELSKFLKEKVPKEEAIFSNIAELGYYSERKLVWDDRLFYVDDEKKLIEILRNYNFIYLVIPYYSGSLPKKSWQYYQAIPSDSTFNTLLSKNETFTIVDKKIAFTIYKFNKNDTPRPKGRGIRRLL